MPFEPMSDEELRIRILNNRNQLYDKSKSKTEKNSILMSHIIGPICAHGSHLIYAPDEIFFVLAKKLISVRPTCPDFKGIGSNMFKYIKEYWWFFLIVLVAMALFAKKGTAIKCEMQNIFLGWAQKNQEYPWWLRFLSISGMMCVRMVLSLVLPFTSPAFAYLIAKSQPPGQEWAGTVYLLVCSAPAGLLIPGLDEIAYQVYGKRMAEKTGPQEYDKKFLATKFMSTVTDNLPFSFWVRPFFMEPAFKVAAEKATTGDEGAAAAAVLAGHFMIWAGPATTMYQRLFVPDILTCIFIQPLGLFEDVAVVLATWAGESVQSQKSAELGLYIFMLIMNGTRYISDKSAKENINIQIQHLTVVVLTLGFMIVRWFFWRWPFPEHYEAITTTTTTPVPQLCSSAHSNVKTMGMTIAFVSAAAFVFRFMALVVSFVYFRFISVTGRTLKPGEEPLLTVTAAPTV